MLCRAANNPVGYRGVGRCPAFFFFFGRDVGQRLSYSCPLSNFLRGKLFALPSLVHPFSSTFSRESSSAFFGLWWHLLAGSISENTKSCAVLTMFPNKFYLGPFRQSIQDSQAVKHFKKQTRSPAFLSIFL